ncbi:MAG: ATP synthase F1 subunit epsilon [Bacilli bacterium]|nr:ATP synthase F1 subunit epsilon [Bacilli bacterium]
MKFKFKVVTPYGNKFDGEVSRVNVKTSTGEIAILARHIPLVSEVVTSILKIHNDNDVLECAISQGVLYVKDDETLLIVNSCETKEEIDFDRALKAKERALERLNKKDENIDIRRAEAALARAENRLLLK